ncbi:MAG: hypothetical protein ACK47V_16330 [Betaproteobacteria bacterium]
MRGVSIVIKCFNEEHKIDAAIASALAAAQELHPIPVEVVVPIPGPQMQRPHGPCSGPEARLFGLFSC